jgi:hypothetical protein
MVMATQMVSSRADLPKEAVHVLLGVVVQTTTSSIPHAKLVRPARSRCLCWENSSHSLQGKCSPGIRVIP